MAATKCIIYARVSSREQEETGYSLPAQEKLLRDYSSNKGFNVEKIFSVSESASGQKQRSVFNKMLETAKNKNIKIIICEKVDRLSRTFKDAVMVDDWLQEDEERQVHLVKNSLIMHKNSRSQEKLNWGVQILFAKNYIDNLSEEVKKGQKEKIAQGQLPQRAKIGYKTIGEKGHKIHVIDEVAGPLMARAFELHATGNYSVKALVETMHKEGLRGYTGDKVGISRMHQLLHDPYYCGKITWNGIVSQGKHEPLITKDLFDAVQRVLDRKRSNPNFQKHFPVFKAKIQCEECGGTVTWETQKGHWYGHCNHYKNCSQNAYVRQEKVEDQLFPLFDNVAPKNDRVLKILEKALRESHNEEIDHNTQKRNEFARIIQTADKRYENAYRDKLDGKMPTDLCQKMMDESAKEKEDAIASLKKLGESRIAYYEAGLQCTNLH